MAAICSMHADAERNFEFRWWCAEVERYVTGLLAHTLFGMPPATRGPSKQYAASALLIVDLILSYLIWLALEFPLTTESPTTHYCTVQPLMSLYKRGTAARETLIGT